MPERSIRVNELIKREISQILHTSYRTEAVRITITGAEIARDLRSGRIFYSVIGDEAEITKTQTFFKRFGRSISAEAGKHIVLKYFPKLRFVFDSSFARGNKILKLLDELDQENKPDQENEPAF